MPITKQVVLDKLEILEDGVIQIRWSTRVFDDDGVTILGERYQRVVLEPGSNIDAYPAKVRNTAAIWWTPAVIAAYQDKIARFLAANQPRPVEPAEALRDHMGGDRAEG